ncbi:MAG TPA: MFS transporter [Verrucomicrobiales bacterium]|nr:MFS transporter [Verrucomicrobiales bacterium]
MSQTSPYQTPKHGHAEHPPAPEPVFDPSTPWYRMLNKHQWFVLTMATLAWVLDCLDQQLFVLARPAAMDALCKPHGMDPKAFGGYATAIFVLGWATGGLIFGAVGDRIGRAKTLTLTVLIYSLCTGLSAFSRNFTEFALYRFVTGLGVGGVFGLAVALVADTLPSQARSKALGTLQAMSAVGNVTAGLCSMWMGSLVQSKVIATGDSWKYLFWIGALPALLCVALAIRMKEPEKWVTARAAGRVTGVKFGSYASLFGIPRWRRHALAGMTLCLAGVIGVWGIGFFASDLVGLVLDKSLRAEGLTTNEVASQKVTWIGVSSIIQNIGAFLGMLAFTWLAQKIGRKRSFVIATLCAMAATIFFFQTFNGKHHVWMSGVMGFFQLALFAGFAIYLPELFPLRLRSTGVSFCYNVGRFLAATGPFTLGVLQAHLAEKAVAGAKALGDAAVLEAKLNAFREAACWVAIVYLIGLVALPFLPETKDHPLPED